MGTRNTPLLKAQVRMRPLLTHSCGTCPHSQQLRRIYRPFLDVKISCLCVFASRVFVSKGGIDLELAPLVVTALDDVCSSSAHLFDEESLGAFLNEVCRWLVEQRLGPHAHHEKYRKCDPYGQVSGLLSCPPLACDVRAMC